MGVSFLELAKSNLAAYLDAQQKDAAHRDARKNGDDIPRHSSLIAEADSVARRVVAEGQRLAGEQELRGGGLAVGVQPAGSAAE